MATVYFFMIGPIMMWICFLQSFIIEQCTLLGMFWSIGCAAVSFKQSKWMLKCWTNIDIGSNAKEYIVYQRANVVECVDCRVCWAGC